MVRTVFGLAIAVVLATVAGCAPIAIQDPHADAGTRMWAVASRLEQDRRTGGMAGTIAGIEQCYQSSSEPLVRIFALRDCMVLDYEAHRIDVLVGRRINGASLPYFEDNTYLPGSGLWHEGRLNVRGSAGPLHGRCWSAGGAGYGANERSAADNP